MSKTPVKPVKKDSRGGKHSAANPQTPRQPPPPPTQPPHTPVAPTHAAPGTSTGGQLPPQGGVHASQQQGWGSPVVTPTHTFAEFCTEVTAAIQPSIAKIIQETLSQHIPLQQPLQQPLNTQHNAPPQNASTSTPPPKRQRVGEQTQPQQPFNLSDDENDLIQASQVTHNQPAQGQAGFATSIPPGFNNAPLPTQTQSNPMQTQGQPPLPPQQDASLADISGHIQHYLQQPQQQQWPASAANNQHYGPAPPPPPPPRHRHSPNGTALT